MPAEKSANPISRSDTVSLRTIGKKRSTSDASARHRTEQQDIVAYAREPVVDWTSKMVSRAIFVANVRHITVDPELSERWAYDPTPDELRVLITVRSIAKIVRPSYGTVFRRCQSLNALNVIRYDRGGWLLESRLLFDEKVGQGVPDLLGYYAKRLNELAAAGFDPGNPKVFYLEKRPEYVALVLR